MLQLNMEEIEIWLLQCMNNINRQYGFKISWAWNPTIRFLQLSDTDKFKNIKWNMPTDPLILQIKCHGGEEEYIQN
jgi:hypothetical protein